jgi:predicted lipid-binding transport protein (Tim44 family)
MTQQDHAWLLQKHAPKRKLQAASQCKEYRIESSDGEFSVDSFVITAFRAYLCANRGVRMMGSSGGFPIDLILFGMIAAFLVLRLRSILGKRTGFEQQQTPPPFQPPVGRPAPAAPIIEGRAEPAPPAASQDMPPAGSTVAQALARMREIDRSFDPARFLAGADQAFRMIVAAFASGDRVALRSLLADDTYRAFEDAISAREKAGEVQVSEIRSIEQLAIEDAELRGTVGTVTTRIVSDQISYTKDRNGRPVAGTDAVTEITDLWTFERDLSQRDPTWRLVAARSG